MITELTPEQEALIPAHRDRWLAYGLSTAPADRPAAEEGIRLAYRLRDLPEPQRIVWEDSPWAGCVLAAKLANDTESPTPTQIRDQLNRVCYGSRDVSWLAFYDFFDQILPEGLPAIRGLVQVAKSAGWWWAFEDVAVVTERPRVLERDEAGRLHCENGPAVLYPDGFGVWSWHGVRLTEKIIERPETVTREELVREPNVEVRRAIIEKLGPEMAMNVLGAEKVMSDEMGTLWRADVPGDEAIVMVQVTNSTPEPDGSWKDYWLRVPPQMTSAHEAVAWTFGMTKAEYTPEIQT